MYRRIMNPWSKSPTCPYLKGMKLRLRLELRGVIEVGGRGRKMGLGNGRPGTSGYICGGARCSAPLALVCFELLSRITMVT